MRTRAPEGLTIVEIINHVTNFGTHDEWSLPSIPCEALNALFVDDEEYSLTTILRELVFAPRDRLQALLPRLRAWHDALQQTGDPCGRVSHDRLLAGEIT